MELLEKLEILADAAKYDSSCSSSGSKRNGKAPAGGIGNTSVCGICHSFAADGRCISLLKVLFTNACIYDCKYCINRRSNDRPRAAFSPEELAELTIGFYRRNYIEGLFLSSGIIQSPDYTCELLIRTLTLLRNHYKFGGYIHVKAIPGADERLIEQLGRLADRMSVNIELPSEQSLSLLAPSKKKEDILKPMAQIRTLREEQKGGLVPYRGAPKFAPAGQSTQLIVGATPDSDLQIMKLAEGLYHKYQLKRVYYSAYLPVNDDRNLPAVQTKPPLLREHRLYQADWLLRFYGFKASELLDEQTSSLNLLVDPKCGWALSHMEGFPVEISKADYTELLRVPGIGVRSARRIMTARREQNLDFEALKRIGVVLKRAQYFITCNGKMIPGLKLTKESALRGLLSENSRQMLASSNMEQLSLFPPDQVTREDVVKCLSGEL